MPITSGHGWELKGDETNHMQRPWFRLILWPFMGQYLENQHSVQRPHSVISWDNITGCFLFSQFVFDFHSSTSNSNMASVNCARSEMAEICTPPINLKTEHLFFRSRHWPCQDLFDVIASRCKSCWTALSNLNFYISVLKSHSGFSQPNTGLLLCGWASTSIKTSIADTVFQIG